MSVSLSLDTVRGAHELAVRYSNTCLWERASVRLLRRVSAHAPLRPSLTHTHTHTHAHTPTAAVAQQQDAYQYSGGPGGGGGGGGPAPAGVENAGRGLRSPSPSQFLDRTGRGASVTVRDGDWKCPYCNALVP